MVKSFTNFVEFFVLLPVLIYFFFLREASLGELSNLYFIVGSVEQLPLVLFDADSQDFNLLGKPLYLYGLEDDYELQVFPEIGFLIVG